MTSTSQLPPFKNLFRVINGFLIAANALGALLTFIFLSYIAPVPQGEQAVEAVTLQDFIPMIIGTPILLIFNFYPRTVLRKLYSRSIDFEARRLRKRLANASLTWYEKRSYIIEFKRMSREELRYSLQLTLSDLPIGITILIAAIQSLMRL